MPKSSRYHPSATDKLPATLQHSCQEAQEEFRKAREDAIQAYGEGDQAHLVAYRALKRKFEKRGNQWIAKASPAA
jgi:cation transport regulator ChaB